MKPSERNAFKAKADEAAREVSRLEKSIANFEPGTLPHKRLSTQLEDARARQRSAAANLSRTTQPN
jgi:exonuclease VII small subunit